MSDLAKNLKDKLTGRFLVIDGPDGAGKSTQIKQLAEHLQSYGVEVVQTRDPGGTTIGDKIRHILLDNSHNEMTVSCEMLLYMASRAQLMGEVIAPAIAKNQCVICDRWVSSTLAYQVAEAKATPQEIIDVYNAALKTRWPDLTIILDLPPDEGLKRITGTPDRMEAKGVEFHQKVYDRFIAQAKEQPDIFALVDATGAVEDVQKRLRETLENWTFPK